jgi:LPS-assembly lipoprotein
MSSFKASNPVKAVSRRTALRGMAFGLLGVGLVGGLAGCGNSGFRPLYGTLGANADAKMAQVEFTSIPGRNGQRIRNELLFKSYGGGNPAPAKYRLDVAIKESAQTTLVLRDGNSAGQIFVIDARFQLIDIATKKVMLEGVSQSRANYERFANAFSNVRSSEEAMERASKTIATDLKARVAAFLSTVES